MIAALQRSRWWIGVVATLLVFALCANSAQAAGGPIVVHGPADLSLPSSDVPPGYTGVPSRSGPLDDAALAPIIGVTTLRTFHRFGLIAGYHGWIESKVTARAPFATYDLYAFRDSFGASSSRLAYQSQVPGTAQDVANDALPKSALIWSNTAVFGKTQPFVVTEILFRVANVVGDVMGYAVGADQDSANAALQQATILTVATVHWLSTRLPGARHGALLPLPLVALPLALQWIQRRKRG